MPLILNRRCVHNRSARGWDGAATDPVNDVRCLFSQSGPDHEQNKASDQAYHSYNDYDYEFV
jgi:hypothetical protein